MNTTDEPVRIAGRINAAVTATLPLLLALGVDPKIVGAIGAAIVAWLLVGAEAVRSKVTPNVNVALTTAEAKELAPLIYQRAKLTPRARQALADSVGSIRLPETIAGMSDHEILTYNLVHDVSSVG